MNERSVQALHDHGDTLPPTDAGRPETILFLAPAQLVQQGDHQASARCTQRMPQGDGSAVDVDFLAIKAQFFFNSQVLGSKGFVYLDQVDVVQSQSGFLESYL